MERKFNQQAKLNIRKGDIVKVISGDSKGQQGRVLQVLREKGRAIVEGVNMVSRHTKPNAANPNGGIIKQEAAVHLSNLMIVDPSTGEPTRIGRQRNDKGKLVRIAKRSGQEIKG